MACAQNVVDSSCSTRARLVISLARRTCVMDDSERFDARRWLTRVSTEMDDGGDAAPCGASELCLTDAADDATLGRLGRSEADGEAAMFGGGDAVVLPPVRTLALQDEDSGDIREFRTK